MLKQKYSLLVLLVLTCFTFLPAVTDTLHCIAKYDLRPPMSEGSYMDIKALGDINADGFDDWAYVFYDINEFYPRDTVQIFFGSDSIDFTPDHSIQAHRIGRIGDVNNDGYDDIAYLRLYINNRYHAHDPKLFILHGGPAFDFVPDDSTILEGGIAYYASYSDIEKIGDLNGDGYDDICCGLEFDLGSHITKPNNLASGFSVEKMFIYLGGDTISWLPNAIIQPPFTYLDSNYYAGYYWGNYIGMDDINDDGYVDFSITYCAYDGMYYYPERYKYYTYVYYGNSDLDSMRNSADTLLQGKIERKLGYVGDNEPLFLFDYRDSLGYNQGYPLGYLNNTIVTYPRVDKINLSPGDIDGNGFDDWCVFNDDFCGFYGDGLFVNCIMSFYLPPEIKPLSSDNIKMNFLGNICGDDYDKLLIAEKSGPNNPYQIYCYSYNEVLTNTIQLNPSSYTLSQNYPNPFNPTTNISYAISEASDVMLSIYDISGHLVETLVDKSHQAGAYRVKWDASKYSSGIYVYRLESSYGTHSRKMVLIK
ncbi:MAG: T9SS type A sorting domain-containing protein [Candidatus Marinimicrobia bacterium]|nr:T9SS type A sorting domain-containing protein [Candidatus Neomarinimicrobiota bacterium]